MNRAFMITKSCSIVLANVQVAGYVEPPFSCIGVVMPCVFSWIFGKVYMIVRAVQLSGCHGGVAR